MANFIKFVGFAILAAGVITFFSVGLGMKTFEPGLTEGFTYEEPHPWRWIYAIAALLSLSFFGSVLLGISRIVEHKENESKYLKEIHDDIRSMKVRKGIVD
ncbi:hypothetical protein [Bacillus haynesii]|uniref:hypothetical protein n=1 Tax=Bacillus haynesii TaxID=1925021 RepID=UPI001F609A4D|nr:hypothetical protein [Bacillus haynesii]MCI4129491.1 hypothetical protein [Bacillus haynesii]